MVEEQNHAKRNKSCEIIERRKQTKISKGTKPCLREQIRGTTKQTNEGNVRFFVQNSPTSEADQNFDQFISPPRPKHCTKSWKSPPNLKKAGVPAREPKSVREQNHAHGNKSAEQRNKTNGPMKKSPSKIPSAKWEMGGARAPGRRTRIGQLIQCSFIPACTKAQIRTTVPKISVLLFLS
jgi:hypothetical protein